MPRRLQMVEAGVAAVAIEELVVGALLDDAAFCQKGECKPVKLLANRAIVQVVQSLDGCCIALFGSC